MIGMRAGKGREWTAQGRLCCSELAEGAGWGGVAFAAFGAFASRDVFRGMSYWTGKRIW
jgi:hypothetical protein